MNLFLKLNMELNITDKMCKLLLIEEDTTGEDSITITHPQEILDNPDNMIMYIKYLQKRLEQETTQDIKAHIIEMYEAENFTYQQTKIILAMLGLETIEEDY